MGRKETKKLQQGVITAQTENKAELDRLQQLQEAEISGIPEDWSEEEKANIRRAKLGGVDIGYDLAGDEASRRYARTGATAGYGELLGELALERTRQKSRAGAELETEFAGEPIRRRLLKSGLRQNLYGTRAGLYGQTLVLPGQQPGIWGDIIGAGGQAGSAAIIAACWIAAALYGENGKTAVLRYWVNEVFPKRLMGRIFRAAYLRIGQRVARWVLASQHLNVVMRKFFDSLHRRAVAELEA